MYHGTPATGTGRVEELVERIFLKYVLRIWKAVDNVNDILKKAECSSHFSYIKSKGELLFLDISGCGYTMSDPDVASSPRFFEEGTSFPWGGYFV